MKKVTKGQMEAYLRYARSFTGSGAIKPRKPINTRAIPADTPLGIFGEKPKTPQIPALPGMTPLGFKQRAHVCAVWSSRGAKHWLHLINNGNGTFSYMCDDGGGYMGYVSAEQAYARVEELLESYAADKIHMRRRG